MNTNVGLIPIYFADSITDSRPAELQIVSLLRLLSLHRWAIAIEDFDAPSDILAIYNAEFVMFIDCNTFTIRQFFIHNNLDSCAKYMMIKD